MIWENQDLFPWENFDVPILEVKVVQGHGTTMDGMLQEIVVCGGFQFQVSRYLWRYTLKSVSFWSRSIILAATDDDDAGIITLYYSFLWVDK